MFVTLTPKADAGLVQCLYTSDRDTVVTRACRPLPHSLGQSMRKFIFLLFIPILPAVLAACLVPPMQPEIDPGPADRQDRPAVRSDLPDLGPAPEIANTVWINSDRPLRLAELEGKVVLIDMWTFG